MRLQAAFHLHALGRDAVLFAGGTGITAFTAFLEGLAPVENVSVTLAYGARTYQLLIYRETVERCARRLSSLDPIFFVEQLSQEGASARAVAREGALSVGAVWSRLRRPLDSNYYISGPPPMLKSIGDDLRRHNIPAEAIHIDAWE